MLWLWGVSQRGLFFAINKIFYGDKFMRLDKYLKVSRIIKRRTVANEACDAGRVTVNGKAARASYDVKVGDIIGINFGARYVRVQVTAVTDVIKKEDAETLFKIVD